MNRINRLFEDKQNDILNIYCTAGYPQLNDTVTVIKSLEQAGADLIELGMPYSDPLADGPTIQASSSVALKNGMSIQTLFQQLEGLRTDVQIPMILMGYLNPVLQYGMEAFLAKCQAVGIDGLILPDLPMYEYEHIYQPLFEQYNIRLIFLITPQTSETRIRKIDSLSNAFIYVVSTTATTGKKSGFDEATIAYFNRIKSMGLKNPTLIGFGISTHESYKAACAAANGAIIGSQFIRVVEKSNNLNADILKFVEGIRGTVSV